MVIKYSNHIILIPSWISIALALIIPALIFSCWGQKRGILKFLMLWSFFNFLSFFSYMLFSHDPFASFAIFHVLAFGLLSLFFWQWWSFEGGKKKKKITWRSNV